MTLNFIAEITLEQAIIFNPLIASPDISLAEAIAYMSAARATCSLTGISEVEKSFLQTDARASCLLVMEGSQLVGVLTERDVVRLSANEYPFKNSLLADVMTRDVITLRQAEFTDIFAALHLLQRHHIRHLPVLGDQGQVVGLLTHETLRHLLRPVDLLRLRVVSEIMASQVIQASPEASISEIARLMAEHQVSSIVIVEPQAAAIAESKPLRVPVGIVTEGDIVQFQALNLNFKQIQAQRVMSTPVFSVRPNDSLWVAQQWMQQKRLGRLVVESDRGELLGIITQSTLLQALNPVEIYKLVEVLEQKVSQLEVEKMELLHNRNTELEGQVQQRTADLKKQNEREQLLSTIATRIHASLELQNILDTVVTEVQQFLRCDRTLIYQFNSDWSGMVTAEAVLPNWSATLRNRITDCCFHDKIHQFYTQGEKHIVSNIYEAGYPSCYIQLLEDYQVKANLVVPILVEQQLWGLLINHQCERSRIWEATDLELLDRIAVQVAIAIQQSQAYEQTQKEIVERRQAEEALRHSEATRQAIIQGIPDLLIRTNMRGERLEVLSGGDVSVLYPPEGIQHPTVFDVLPKPFVSQQLQYIQQAITTGQLQTYEHQIEIHHQTRWEEIRVAPLMKDEAIVIIRDITDRKQAEAAFQSLVEGAAAIAGENFFTELVQYIAEVLNVRYVMVATQHDNSLKSAAFWLDGQVQPNILYCLENTPCNLAVTLGEYVCLSGVQQHFPDNQALKTLDADVYVGIALTGTHGEIIGCLYVIDSKPLTQPQLTIAMLRVFAARVSAELERQAAIDALKRLNEDLENRIAQRTLELRQSEERFRQVFEQSPVGIAISDLEGHLTSANSSLVQILGYPKSDLLQWSIQDILSAKGQQQGVQRLQQLLEQTLPMMTFESQLISKRGETVWVNVTSALIFNGFARPSAIVHLIEDVTFRKQMELELQELTLSLQNAMEGISRLDKHGRYLTLNRAYAKPYGYEPEELVGAKWQITTYPEDLALMKSAYQTMLEKGKVEAEAIGIRKDGSLFYKQVTMVKSLDQEGQFNGHYCFLKDISDRKSTEATLQRQLAAIEAAIDGIAILEDNTYTYLNKAHLELFGYERPEELLGKSWMNLYSPEEVHRFTQDVFPGLMQQKSWQGEAIAIRKDGSTFNEGLSLTITESGALICVCRDITEQKQAEAKIRQANEQLLLANAELARATRLKDEFLANMSHELRTPLNAILGMAEGLQEEIFGEINKAQERAVVTIDRSGRHLLELINDILDVSKIESGKLELQITSVSIKHLCETSLTFVRQLAIRKNVRLTTNILATLPNIPVDERRIRQVLINLLNNAVKFTPEGGSVELIVSQENQETTCSILFQICDTGPGIAPEDMIKLFQPFVQIDSSLTRQHMGTGLGLALVQQFTQLHGGKVTVTSEVGQGSCFTVQIPYICMTENPAPLVSSIEPITQPSNRTVLVIEDTLSAAEQTTRYLAEIGLKTVVHPTGQGALEIIIEIQPVLVILDILLPDLSGWDILTQLKATPQTEAIPVVIASVVDELSRGLSLGASGYLVKPIDRSQLHATLNFLQIPITLSSSTPPSSHKSTFAAPLILLAEDNAANVATLSGYLSNRGFQLMLAKDGLEAIALTEAHQPDLILMDIQMPQMDGLSAIRQIRTNPAIAHIPIIALTALAMPNDREKCINAGANEYITKPVKLKSLVEVMRRLL